MRIIQVSSLVFLLFSLACDAHRPSVSQVLGPDPEAEEAGGSLLEESSTGVPRVVTTLKTSSGVPRVEGKFRASLWYSDKQIPTGGKRIASYSKQDGSLSVNFENDNFDDYTELVAKKFQGELKVIPMHSENMLKESFVDVYFDTVEVALGYMRLGSINLKKKFLYLDPKIELYIQVAQTGDPYGYSEGQDGRLQLIDYYGVKVRTTDIPDVANKALLYVTTKPEELKPKDLKKKKQKLLKTSKIKEVGFLVGSPATDLYVDSKIGIYIEVINEE